MDYFSRLMQLCTHLSKHHGHMYREGQLDKQVKEAFFTGLRPEYQALVSHMKDDPFKSTLDLFNSVRECEENEENSRRSWRADNARVYPTAVSRAPPAQARGNGNGGYQAHTVREMDTLPELTRTPSRSRLCKWTRSSRTLRRILHKLSSMGTQRSQTGKILSWSYSPTFT